MQQLDIPISGGRIAVVGDNASGKTILTKSLARRQDVRFLTFRDSYGYSADRDFFMQQRWNLFTLGVDTPSVEKILSDEAEASDNPREALARLNELTALFGLKDLLDRPLVTLSSGELRKYQIIKALIKIPAILVIDNPYIGLDPAARTLLTKLLSQILELTSLSVVLILSREEEIPPFINRIIRVENGEIVEDMDCKTYFEKHYPKEIIRLRNVSIKYDSRTILDSLDWVVREGE
ncbi:MAG: AAA family ATPase, partial [Bacteroidales bacterium]|nr:AAA family ATPase [Bacteroidales bacterium]